MLLVVVAGWLAARLDDIETIVSVVMSLSMTLSVVRVGPAWLARHRQHSNAAKIQASLDRMAIVLVRLAAQRVGWKDVVYRRFQLWRRLSFCQLAIVCCVTTNEALKKRRSINCRQARL